MPAITLSGNSLRWRTILQLAELDKKSKTSAGKMCQRVITKNFYGLVDFVQPAELDMKDKHLLAASTAKNEQCAQFFLFSKIDPIFPSHFSFEDASRRHERILGKKHLELKLRDHVRPASFQPVPGRSGRVLPGSRAPAPGRLDGKCAKRK